MISNLLAIGNKITLVKIDTEVKSEKVQNNYVSQLLEYDGADEAKIAMPIVAGAVIPLELGGAYALTFFTNSGMYQCNAIITKRYKEQKIYILEVRFTSDFQKKQRRQYYRMDCLLDMSYRIETQEEIVCLRRKRENDFASDDDMKECLERLQKIQATWCPAVVTDISGGGLRCNSESSCGREEKIHIKLLLHNQDKAKELIVTGTVIDSRLLSNRPGFFEHRIEFTRIRKDEREEIIRFIFEEERRIRKKEKGYE